jgi:probable phosphoglycerate mutase
MDPLLRLVLVRHGESVATVKRMIGGPRSCAGLSALGVLQAERLRDRIAEDGDVSADVLVSSGYPRALQTAEIIAPALAVDVKVVSELGEHDPGPVCDGLSFEDYVGRYGTPRWDDPHAEVFPEGETAVQFHARIHAAVDALLAEHAGLTVMVVCHGGVVDAVMRRAVGAPVRGAFDLFTKNTSVTEFLHVSEDRWRLERYNDAAHLAGLPIATNLTPAG